MALGSQVAPDNRRAVHTYSPTQQITSSKKTYAEIDALTWQVLKTN